MMVSIQDSGPSRTSAFSYRENEYYLRKKTFNKASLQGVTQRRESLLIHSNVVDIHLPTTMTVSLIFIYRSSLIHISTHISLFMYLKVLAH